ncbi:MAG: type IV pilus twitching motility protein PilT [Myxococcota bacterium]|nr:type IV pilus twitching motility protein PilT [Myxococcota bacterium]
MTPEEFHKILRYAVDMRASDVHLKVPSPPSFRIDGVMRAIQTAPLRPDDTLALAEHVVQAARLRVRPDEISDLDLAYSCPGVGRFRVNIFRQRGSLSLVLRTISERPPTFEDLGLPPVLRKVADQPRGMVLVTGATGSGKTSTLAAIIHHINQTRPVHVITIEDPIEFLHSNAKAWISQREVGTDTRDFTVALRAALRQDPDVILLGEIRDHETADIALKAAETGHLVLSTVHTPDAAKTIDRLMALFPPEEQDLVRRRLAENLRATISQRLLQRSDGQGRVAALEIMIVTGTVREWLLEMTKATGIRDIIEKSREQYGMQTFDQCLTDLYRGDLVSLDVAKAAATSPADFVRALHFE